MRQRLTCLSLAAAILLAGCGSGVDADRKKSPEQFQKDLEKMSVSDLEARLKEVEARGKELSAGGAPSSEPEMKELMELQALGTAYAFALAQKKR